MVIQEICISCRKPQGIHACGLCAAPVCRGCEHFLEAGTFGFLPQVADELKHSYYCQACYSATVEPALVGYQERVEKARGVYFFFDSRKKTMPVLKKAREAISVVGCVDRDETILRMGFMAASL